MDKNMTLAEYLAQHPTLIEDLRIASKLVYGKRAVLAGALISYAADFMEVSPYDCEEWKSPFESANE